MCLLCMASASAVTYGNPYRGAGRNGYVGTGYRATTGSRSSGLSQAPTATMRTTSSAGFGAAYTGTTQAMSGVTMQVQGMYTAATGVRGGVTTYDSYSGPRRTAGTPPPTPGDPGYCEGCQYVWDPTANAGDGGWVCTQCGHGLEEGCHCDPCQCPIGDGWDVWIMLAVMAAGYAAWARRRRECVE